jgi:DNA-binding NtrC family response regulator
MARAHAANHRVLIVTAEEEAWRELSALLRAQGYPLARARSAAEGLERLKDRHHEIVIVDADLPRGGAAEIVGQVRGQAHAPPVVLLAGADGLEEALAGLERGATDYLSRPPHRVEVAARVARILENRELDDRLARLQDEMARRGRLDGISARSPAMKELVDRVRRLATTRSTVLILGESGTGKELAARTIHFASPRRDGPFLPINCAAIAPNLIESELFGHEKGAFTGAVSRQKGKFELAQGGTLFLDEVAETDPATQAKLLRALEEREFMRVGGSRAVRVDVRVLAATNADLEALVREGRFRQDLYYRLKVVTVRVPPLRERREDLPDLAEHYIREICRANGLPVRNLRPEALTALLQYSWPGNVRELINALEAALVSTRGAELRVEDLPANIREASDGEGAADLLRPGLTLAEMERELIRRTLIHEGGHRQRTARSLGIGERTLRRKIGSYALEAPRRRGREEGS